MTYEELMKPILVAHIDEIRGDLDHGRSLLGQARGRTSELERQVASLERLLAIASTGDDLPEGHSGTTLHGAMLTVLKDAPEHMMRAGDLAAEIARRGLYKMRDGRPAEPQQIHARVGNYPHLFVRVGTFIKALD